MIQLKQKTPHQIKQEQKFNEKKKAIMKTFIKKKKSSSNINFFNTDKTIYQQLEKQNQKTLFTNYIPVFTIIIMLFIFICTILYFNFNNIIKSKFYTFIFIFLIVSLISIATFITLKFYLVDSKI